MTATDDTADRALVDLLNGYVVKNHRDPACCNLARLMSEAAEALARRITEGERLTEHEALLRSACAIAERRGEGTAWERFIESVFALGLNGVTARTYRVLPHEAAAVNPACPDCGQPQHSPGDCYAVVIPSNIDAIARGLADFLEHSGGLHEDDCPMDDTCACCYARENAMANAAARLLQRLADDALVRKTTGGQA